MLCLFQRISRSPSRAEADWMHVHIDHTWHADIRFFGWTSSAHATSVEAWSPNSGGFGRRGQDHILAFQAPASCTRAPARCVLALAQGSRICTRLQHRCIGFAVAACTSVAAFDSLSQDAIVRRNWSKSGPLFSRQLGFRSAIHRKRWASQLQRSMSVLQKGPVPQGQVVYFWMPCGWLSYEAARKTGSESATTIARSCDSGFSRFIQSYRIASCPRCGVELIWRAHLNSLVLSHTLHV